MLVGHVVPQRLCARPAVPDRDRPPDLGRHRGVVGHHEHGHADVPISSSLRARYEAFLKKGEHGYVLRRDLAFRDGFRRALDSGALPATPAFLWPMLAELTVPVFVIRASESNMFAPETLDKVRKTNPRITATELAGSHDLAGDNPEGLVKAVRDFLMRNDV